MFYIPIRWDKSNSTVDKHLFVIYKTIYDSRLYFFVLAIYIKKNICKRIQLLDRCECYCCCECCLRWTLPLHSEKGRFLQLFCISTAGNSSRNFNMKVNQRNRIKEYNSKSFNTNFPLSILVIRGPINIYSPNEYP